ncbi:MAG TPA: cupin domain-containing protein [Clostridia bacterium]|nr:cupin domain-containing protein [Clostridia bacterium]
MLEGTLRVRIDDRELYLHPGDSVYFDSNHPHALQAAEGNAVKMLAIVIP